MTVTGWPIDVLLRLARTIAAHNRLVTIAQMPAWAFALLIAGLLWVCLWTTRVRLFGLFPLVIGAIGTFLALRPDLLITGDGRPLAVVTVDGTSLILGDWAGDYVRSLLSEASGFDGDSGELCERPFSDCSDDACVAEMPRGTRRWRLLATRSAYRIDWDPLTKACAQSDVVFSDRRLPRA